MLLLSKQRRADQQPAKTSGRQQESSKPNEQVRRHRRGRVRRSEKEDEQELRPDQYQRHQQQDDDHETNWRHSAQMLTDEDEMRLLLGVRSRTPLEPLANQLDNFGQDELDVAPVRRSQRQQSAINKFTQRPKSDDLSKFLVRSQRRDANADEDEDADGNSSNLSFAQSGCQSILSAWRLKAANRVARQLAAAKQQAEQPRPQSVLSNASSGASRRTAGASTILSKSLLKAPAAKQRIPLGFSSARASSFRQPAQLVTNTKRRRRANELILNTLEARRRAIAANRQNLGSLFGSAEFYPNDFELNHLDDDTRHLMGRPMSPTVGRQVDEYHRLAATPSPLGSAGRHSADQMAAAAAAAARLRSAQSDLGADGRLAHQGQRNKLLELLASGHRRSLGARVPPLARSSASSLSSSSASLSSTSTSSPSSSSSEGRSQLTQMVSAELAPSCDELLRSGRSFGAVASSPPKPAARDSKRQTQLRTRVLTPPARVIEQQQQEKEPTPTPSPPQPPPAPASVISTSSSFRRGALKRDSIRRMRLSRATRDPAAGNQQEAEQRSAAAGRGHVRATRSQQFLAFSSSSSSSAEVPPLPPSRSSTLVSAAPPAPNSRHDQRPPAGETTDGANSQAVVPRPLSKARKLDIESNPFLNRYHFRTLSTRSSTSTNRSSGDSIRGLAARDDLKLDKIGRRVAQVEEMIEQMNNKENGIGFASSPPPPPPSLPPPTRQEISRIESRRTQLHQKLPKDEVPRAAERRSRAPIGLGSQNELTDDRSRKDAAVSRLRPLESRKSASRIDDRDQRRSQETDIVVRSIQSTEASRFVSRQRLVSPDNSARYRAASRPASGPLTSPPVESRKPPVAPRPRATVTPTNRTIDSQVKLQTHAPNRTQKIGESSPSLASVRRSQQLSKEELERRTQELIQANLPKLEPSADDEFRKRVDQLRRLARANLEADEPIVRSTPADGGSRLGCAPARKDRSQILSSATKQAPTTNWKGWSTTNSALGRRSVSPAPSMTTTNLDLISVDTKPTASTWRRSNSSLASLTSRPIDNQQQRQPVSSNKDDVYLKTTWPKYLPPQAQDSSADDNASELTSPMRVVVREKSAPRLDFAFVEQRPSVEYARQVSPRPAEPVASASRLQSLSGSHRLMPQAPLQRPQQHQKELPTARPASRSEGVAPSTSASIQRAPANSSTEDSAIASTVSSPSLSSQSAAGPLAGSMEQRSVSPARHHDSHQQVATAAAANSRDVGGGVPRPMSTPAGILRRQQLQQQQHQLDANEVGQRRALGHQAGEWQPVASSGGGGGGTSSPQLAPSPPNSAMTRRQDELLFVRSDAAPAPAPASGELAPSSTKRVHFNDRASVRSFESISSFQSDSAADGAGASQFEAARQLVGSPDSVGSGSTSRMSVESPDGSARVRATGAAIYAIRGDPELEFDQQQHSGHSFELMRANVGANLLSPTKVVAQQQQQQQQQRLTVPLAHRQQLASSGPLPAAAAVQQQRARLPPPPAVPMQQFIRMTAPPSISTIARPLGASQQPTARFVAFPQPSLSQPPRQLPEDDDDRDYALQLRQATSRAFGYTPAPLQQQQQQPQFAPRPLGSGQAQQQQQQQQQAGESIRKTAFNFHTEV